MRPRRWRFQSPDPDFERRLAAELGIAPLAARVLANRRPGDLAQARAFVDADIKQLSDPAQFPDMAAATSRLGAAIEAGERILIHGDYDVDGLTGSSLLYHFLRELGADVDVLIPERLKDGYGLSETGLRNILEHRPEVVVTVDHGISAVDAITRLSREGIDVIVTDHHQLSDRLPEALALIHPALLEEGQRCAEFSGAGVAFKLACALFQTLPSSQRKLSRIRDALRDALAFAAMGTVADVMPMRGENRALVRHGLKRLAETQRPGLHALLKVATARSTSPELDAEDIGFGMAPRLNAAGRMGQVALAKQLLMCDDRNEAQRLTKTLDELNLQRRAVEARVTERALELAADYPEDPVLCLADPAFHVGVMGISASRLVELSGRPAILIGTEGQPAKGSGRAPPGFDLAAALRDADAVLRRHGGHAAAAGLEIDEDAVPALRERLVDWARRNAPELEVDHLDVDAEVRLDQIDRRLVQDLSSLGPFGEGNRKPLFACSDVQHVQDPRCVGAKQDHLLMKLRYRGAQISAIAFRQGDRREEAMGEDLSIVFSPRLTTFPGGPPVELIVQDLRSRRSAPLDGSPASTTAIGEGSR